MTSPQPQISKSQACTVVTEFVFLVVPAWSLSQFCLSVGPKYSGCLGINTLCWQLGNPIKTWYCKSLRGESAVLLFCSISNLWPFKTQENTTKKWTFLLFIINCMKHLDQHVGASLPIASGTRLHNHTHRARHLLKAYKDFCLLKWERIMFERGTPQISPQHKCAVLCEGDTW